MEESGFKNTKVYLEKHGKLEKVQEKHGKNSYQNKTKL